LAGVEGHLAEFGRYFMLEENTFLRGLIIPTNLERDAYSPSFDDYYEKPKQSDYNRIVISTPEKLRAYLLYWDRLAIFRNGRLECRLSDDENWMVKIGVLQILAPTDTIDKECQFATLDGMESADQVSWAFASNWWEGPKDTTSRSLLVKLHNVLPVPNENIPFEEILAFRERRSPERLALRHYLERVYQTILSAPDDALAFRTEFESLALAIRDQMAVLEEARLPFALGKLEAKLHWEFAPGLVGLGGIIGATLGHLEAAVAGALAGLAANLVPKIDLEFGAATIKAKKGHPLEYVVHVAREL
jgi:hypothetical protein